jgi:hypothetical protein
LQIWSSNRTHASKQGKAQSLPFYQQHPPDRQDRQGFKMFKLEWNRGSIIVGTFAEVESHPAFLYATILRRVPFGWEVI